MDNKIEIAGKTYEYINNIKYDNKMYIAYMDNDIVYISEYILDGDKLIIKDIDDATFNKVKEVILP